MQVQACSHMCPHLDFRESPMQHLLGLTTWDMAAACPRIYFNLCKDKLGSLRQMPIAVQVLGGALQNELCSGNCSRSPWPVTLVLRICCCGVKLISNHMRNSLILLSGLSCIPIDRTELIDNMDIDIDSSGIQSAAFLHSSQMRSAIF